MLHKNFKTFKRSVSEILLRKTPQKMETEPPDSVPQRHSTPSQPFPDKDDPYQEILRTYRDNVSHLRFHGSSLKSMSEIDFASLNNQSIVSPLSRNQAVQGGD